jgi:cyclin C
MHTKFVSRFIINDTYRSQLCLLYPPHLIAVAAIYLTLVLHGPTRDTMQAHAQQARESDVPHFDSSLQPAPRRSSRQSQAAVTSAVPPSLKRTTQTHDAVAFLADLNISMSLIATIAQEIICLYKLWERYKEDVNNGNGTGSGSAHTPGSPYAGSQSSTGASMKRPISGIRSGNTSLAGTPRDDVMDTDVGNAGNVVTPTFLTNLLMKMREDKLADMAHPESGRPPVINRLLERTQAAG